MAISPDAQDTTLWDSLVYLADSQEKGIRVYLGFDKKSGTFFANKASFFERCKMFCGLSRMSAKKVVQAMKARAQPFYQMVENKKHPPKMLREVQTVINRLSFAAGEKKTAVDLFEKKHESWMQNLPEAAKNKKLNELLLPATHDSAAYSMDFSNPIATNKRGLKAANLACKILPFMRRIISNWSVTQAYTIEEQLKKGIRSFDFRISYNANDKKFYFTHTFTCIPVEKALDDIAAFMATHPGEVIIANCKPDWEHREGMKGENGNAFLDLIKQKLGTFLCPPTIDQSFDDSMTLSSMVTTGKRILVSYDGEMNPAINTFLWPASAFRDAWDNTSDVEEKKKCLDARISTSLLQGNLQVTDTLFMA